MMKRILLSVFVLLMIFLLGGCQKEDHDISAPPLVKSDTNAPGVHTSVTSNNLGKNAILADRLSGVYQEVVKKDAMLQDEKHLIRIYCIGGTLLIENNTEYSGYWAQEVRPVEEEVLFSTNANEVMGANLMFSTMSNYGEYWDATTDLTVTLTEDGVKLTNILDDQKTEEIYRRIEDEGKGEGEFHSSLEQQKEILAQLYEITNERRVVGEWSFTGGTCAAWLSLREDGAFVYAIKVKGTPICIYQGAWAATKQGKLVFSAERFGGGMMPYEWEFRYRVEDGMLYLTDAGDFPMLPVEGEHQFVDVDPEWMFSPYLYETDDMFFNEENQLDVLRSVMEEAGCGVAVAYLGNFSESPDDLNGFLYDSGAIQYFPFLAEMDINQFVDYEGEELYLIVPRDEDANVEVRKWYMNELNGYMGGIDPYEQPLYSGDFDNGVLGSPFLLRCNISDIMPNTVIYLVQSNGFMEYSPCLSLMDGTLNYPGVHEFGYGVLDITLYRDAY